MQNAVGSLPVTPHFQFASTILQQQKKPECSHGIGFLNPVLTREMNNKRRNKCVKSGLENWNWLTCKTRTFSRDGSYFYCLIFLTLNLMLIKQKKPPCQITHTHQAPWVWTFGRCTLLRYRMLQHISIEPDMLCTCISITWTPNDLSVLNSKTVQRVRVQGTYFFYRFLGIHLTSSYFSGQWNRKERGKR